MGDIKDLFENVDNVQLKLAFEFIQYTNKNIFLTGKAGTGKTTFLKSLKENLPKRMIVVAPTGVAAINAGGVTIHSFFQLPFGPQIPLDNENKSENAFKRNNYKFNITKIDIIKSLDLLVIDEISMVRADLLDGIDEVLRRYKEKDKFFGGVQLLMIGDLQQLSPVVRDSEWEILKSYYDNMYFFSSRALKSTQCICVELKHIYRQKDDYFIDLLNKVRNNELSADTLNKINKRFEEKFTKDVPEGYIILTTHNSKAQKINGFKLKQLKTDEFIFEAEIEGNFPENSYPIEYTLSFKKGAQVMFVKNDTSAEKLFYNGKIGKIENIKDNIIYVKCENENDYIEVTPVEWENIKYTINNENKEIESKVEGRFTQFPLRLAWSITIHKSQGLTFEKAIIDAKNAFSHGQVYVALSRCKTLEGLFLNSKISSECIINDKIVTDFTNKIGLDTPDRLLLEKSKYEYQKILLLDLFEFSNIARLFGYCLKIYRENKGSLQQSFYDVADKILNLINNDLIIVSKKFETQIEKILEFDQDIENNKKLNERIKKACAYFREKIENNILKSLKDIN
ncbi:MAG: AAA family ATPase, partial [Clostridiales bacterium]